MKQTLFLVHGIGAHEKDTWITPAKDALRTAYGKYPSLKDRYGTFGQALDVVPINYDSIFERILKTWADSAKNIRAGMLDGQIGAVDKALDFIELLNSNKYVKEYLLDLIFWSLVPTVREWVITAVRSQITTYLENHADVSDGNWHILGHSMGTSVVHDVLHELSLAPNWKPKDTWAGTVIMVSNCSNLIHARFRPNYGVYGSNVRPQLAPGTTMCSAYLNIKHHLDIVAMPDPFDPHTGWAPAQVKAKGLYKEVAFNDARVRNIHALENYLENPLVHAAIFRRILPPPAAFQAEFEAEAAKYDKKSDLAEFEALRTRLSALSLNRKLTFEGIKDIKDILGALKEFFTTLIKL